MNTRNSMSRALLAFVLAVAMVLGFSSPAFAHDPIFITADQIDPDTGPFMPDGTISWALYGSVLETGDTRGFEFDLRDGDEVFVSLLIPNLSPEVDLADEDLPRIELEAPDGTVVTIAPEVRDVFDEPFSNTSYVTLAEYREPAQAGRYRGVIVGNAPSRFSVAIGETEIFFTETERSGDRPSNFAEITVPLTAWYTTPPGGEPDASALEDGEGEIQLDLIEEAMESGEAEAPEESLEAGEAMAEAQELSEEAMAEEAAAEEAMAAEEADPEPADPDPEPEDLEPVDAGESAEEVAAAAPLAGDGGSSSTWVAPVVIGAIAVVGGGVYAASRRKS